MNRKMNLLKGFFPRTFVVALLLTPLAWHTPVQSAPPSGIFCSCGITTGSGTGSVAPKVAEKDFVSGILVRVRWKDLEPSDDSYQWSLIDGQIERANDYGTLITLAVINGPGAPSWLYNSGVESYSVSGGKMPIPSDPEYLAEWEELVGLLGERYRNESTIVLLHMTHSTLNGFEMHVPSGLSSRGVTEQDIIDSWEQIIDAFSAAFPNTYLDVMLQHVFNKANVASAVWEYGSTKLGDRFGVGTAIWSAGNAAQTTGTNGTINSILRESASRPQGFSSAQWLMSAVQQPSRCYKPYSGQTAEQCTEDTLDAAIDYGIGYVEIWNADLLDSSLEDELRDGAQQLP